MQSTDRRRLIFNAFSKLHDQLSLVRGHVEEFNDPEASELLERMERGLLAPMRRLRRRLDIPYYWRGESEPLGEA
jgi:hypothetical protein